MWRLTLLGLLALAPFVAPPPLAAQDGSAIDDLIYGARRALNDLEYARADSIARSLLAMGSRATPEQRVLGLQLLAAALYPEERAAQRLDSARRYVKELVRATPDAAVPSVISWPGLDSLVTAVRANTFAIWAAPAGRYELEGEDAEVRIEVTAARVAWFMLTATALGDGSSLLLDSAGPARSVTLRIPALTDDRPALPWGQYQLQVLGVDSLSGDAMELSFLATVETPPLLQHRIPSAPDSSLFRPERAAPRTFANLAVGAALGAATGLAASAFGGNDPVGSSTATGRAYIVGIGMSVGAVIGALTDRGKPLPANIQYNATVRAAFEQRVEAVRAENAQRRAEYHATITLSGGVP
jgi:hypothetical protein